MSEISDKVARTFADELTARLFGDGSCGRQLGLLRLGVDDFLGAATRAAGSLASILDSPKRRRDRFIAAALTGLLTFRRAPDAESVAALAREALLAADAVLAALDKERS